MPGATRRAEARASVLGRTAATIGRPADRPGGRGARAVGRATGRGREADSRDPAAVRRGTAAGRRGRRRTTAVGGGPGRRSGGPPRDGGPPRYGGGPPRSLGGPSRYGGRGPRRSIRRLERARRTPAARCACRSWSRGGPGGASYGRSAGRRSVRRSGRPPGTAEGFHGPRRGPDAPRSLAGRSPRTPVRRRCGRAPDRGPGPSGIGRSIGAARQRPDRCRPALPADERPALPLGLPPGFADRPPASARFRPESGLGALPPLGALPAPAPGSSGPDRQPCPASTLRRQRCPSRVSSTVTPCVGELVAQSVGCREVAGGARRGTLVEQGRDLGFEVLGLVGQDRQHPVEVAQRRERAAGVRGRQRAALEPPVEVAHQVEDGGQRRRDVQVVVERRPERLARGVERLGQRRHRRGRPPRTRRARQRRHRAARARPPAAASDSSE